MQPYHLDKLMEQTRRLAADYRLQTGQSLAVSTELARYDTQQLFQFKPNQNALSGVDFMGVDRWENESIQVKSRVIFNHKQSNYRIGQLQLGGSWTWLFLVLYEETYLPSEIFAISKSDLIEHLKKTPNKRGAMTVRQFKMIASRVWSEAHGFETDVWDNQSL